MHGTKHWATKEASTELLDIPVPEVHQPVAVQESWRQRQSGLKWAVTEMTVTDDGFEIATALQQGLTGSFKDCHGTAAIVIEGSMSHGPVVGVNVMPSEEESQSPHQNEPGRVTVSWKHCSAFALSMKSQKPWKKRLAIGHLILANRIRTRCNAHEA
jgi:hypothetical protein